MFCLKNYFLKFTDWMKLPKSESQNLPQHQIYWVNLPGCSYTNDHEGYRSFTLSERCLCRCCWAGLYPLMASHGHGWWPSHLGSKPQAIGKLSDLLQISGLSFLSCGVFNSHQLHEDILGKLASKKEFVTVVRQGISCYRRCNIKCMFLVGQLHLLSATH